MLFIIIIITIIIIIIIIIIITNMQLKIIFVVGNDLSHLAECRSALHQTKQFIISEVDFHLEKHCHHR